MKMKFSTIALICTAFLLTMLNLTPTQAWIRGSVDLFAVLPPGSTGPEGLTVGPDGNVYVTTFGFNASGPVGGLGQLFVFKPNGHLLRQVGISGSSANLLGLAFTPSRPSHPPVLLVIDFGHANVLAVDPRTGASSVFMTVTG